MSSAALSGHRSVPRQDHPALSDFAALAGEKVVAITIYRRSGDEVTTPVNRFLSDGKAYVFTAAERGRGRAHPEQPAFRRKVPVGNRFPALRVRMGQEHSIYIEVVPTTE